MKISISVKPNSRAEGVDQAADGSLVVRVNAPPVEGRANERVIEILARHLKVPKSRLRIALGGRGKRKVVEVL